MKTREKNKRAMARELGIPYGAATAERAHDLARAVAKKLGKGWTATVYSYFGWRWTLSKGKVQVANSARGVFTAKVMDPEYGYFACGDTPGKALRKLHTEVSRELRSAQDAVAQVTVARKASPPRDKSPARKPAARPGKKRKGA